MESLIIRDTKDTSLLFYLNLKQKRNLFECQYPLGVALQFTMDEINYVNLKKQRSNRFSMGLKWRRYSVRISTRLSSTLRSVQILQDIKSVIFRYESAICPGTSIINRSLIKAQVRLNELCSVDWSCIAFRLIRGQYNPNC